MKIRNRIITAAETAFDHCGFTATGMDRLTETANVSSRTLYKHLGNKNALIVAALEHRRRRFFAQLDVQSVDALFAALLDWTEAEGARGCLFLRATGETGGEVPEISDAVTAYRTDLRDLIERLVVAETGSTHETDTILVLFEGAVTAACYRGTQAIAAARTAAAVVLKQPRQPQ
ncbi:TetR family transcriptional regulator [Citromicrobium sp. JL31]|nr:MULTISPECIES: TetR/AcrR family transcriptional regulator [unclassified Citromicrobium]KPM17660.1 TetR family transcriptional regulator [Citromicrobium sp. JL31]KPM18626.1 TetR family transcriptional regulator [Citromicrobium sp. JL1351]KPM29616.1 TetR family transcriptional regulator [Citromicrobium sp. JL2201]